MANWPISSPICRRITNEAPRAIPAEGGAGAPVGLLAVFIAAAQTPAPAAAPHDETRTTYLLGPDDTVTIRARTRPT